MTQITVNDAITAALQSQRMGQLDDAEHMYRQILQTYPDQQDALHLLGAVLYERGKVEEALEHLQRAVVAGPGQPSFRLTLGVVYQAARRFGDAIRTYEELIALHPQSSEAHDHLGVVLSLDGRYEDAAREFKRAIAIAPGNAVTEGNLGVVLCRLRRFDEAIWVLRGAVARLPQNVTFHAALASALYFKGQYEAALASCREGIRLGPQRGDIHLTLSATFNALDRETEALEPARRAANLLPEVVDVHINLGETLRRVGRMDECVVVYRLAIGRFPDAPALYTGLANALRDIGELDESLAMYRRAMEICPDPVIHSAFLYTLQFHPTIDPGNIFKHHRDFDRLYAEPLARSPLPYTNDPTPDRRLRVGYISSEFRSHALGQYMVPLMANHDKAAFEIFSYVHTRIEDATTFQLKEYSDHWKSIRDLTDDQVAALVRADGIDVLIDLHQHMGGAGNRILIYARKPAPVQIAFAGYPGTTGLSMIDYRLTDRHLEPPDGFPVPSSETPILLPDTFWCYFPRAAVVPVSPLPALHKKHVSFGNFNSFCKVNQPTLSLWAKVLSAVPDSTLTLLAPEGAHRDRTRAFLKTQGVDPQRIHFVPWQKGWAYFELYHGIDIGLDTFPYNGHTTSLDSLFMGVPVVTLAGAEGATPVSRAGWSQLFNLNLAELAAFTPEEFVNIATKLAGDIPKLAELRSTMRTRFMASPLVDGPRFARNVEAAYRTAWKRWCQKQSISR